MQSQKIPTWKNMPIWTVNHVAFIIKCFSMINQLLYYTKQASASRYYLHHMLREHENPFETQPDCEFEEMAVLLR